MTQSYGEEVRMDKLSEQVRKMVGEWRREVAERNRIGVGPSGGMAFAYQRCADTLESLLPQIEAMEHGCVITVSKGAPAGTVSPLGEKTKWVYSQREEGA